MNMTLSSAVKVLINATLDEIVLHNHHDFDTRSMSGSQCAALFTARSGLGWRPLCLRGQCSQVPGTDAEVEHTCYSNFDR
jgi:hypothetical protein